MLNLTQKEKLCFWGLVKYPNLNDSQLSEKIGLKRSTVTSIRNKLKEKKLFETLYLPNFKQLDCEIISVLYGELNCNGDEYVELFDSISKIPNMIYCYISRKNFFIIFVEKNYGDFLGHCYECLDIMEDSNILRNYKYVNFPFDYSTVFKFCDFSGMLKDLFGLTVDESNSEKKLNNISLTKKEKVVMQALVSYPDKTDTFLAEKTNTARPTISIIKNKLLSNDVVTTIRIPKLDDLTFNVLVLNHVKLKKKFWDTESNWIKNNFNFFLIANKRNALSLSVHKDQTVYKNFYQNYFEVNDFSSFRSEPYDLSIFLNEPFRSKLNFSALVNQALK